MTIMAIFFGVLGFAYAVISFLLVFKLFKLIEKLNADKKVDHEQQMVQFLTFANAAMDSLSDTLLAKSLTEKKQAGQTESKAKLDLERLKDAYAKADSLANFSKPSSKPTTAQAWTDQGLEEINLNEYDVLT